jgi:hypothetical protein
VNGSLPTCAVAVAAAGLAGCSGDDSTAIRPAAAESQGIVVQRSIAGLRLGMSAKAARAVLGEPDAVRRQSESETGRRILHWVYRQRKVAADFRRGRAGLRLVSVSTRSPRYRTASGLGAGSSESEVKHRLGGADCGPADPGTRWCTVDGSGPGDTQTIFRLRRGRVFEVTVTRVFR